MCHTSAEEKIGLCGRDYDLEPEALIKVKVRHTEYDEKAPGQLPTDTFSVSEKAIRMAEGS